VWDFLRPHVLPEAIIYTQKEYLQRLKVHILWEYPHTEKGIPDPENAIFE
jgi:hypothetical protein